MNCPLSINTFVVGLIYMENFAMCNFAVLCWTYLHIYYIINSNICNEKKSHTLFYNIINFGFKYITISKRETVRML